MCAVVRRACLCYSQKRSHVTPGLVHGGKTCMPVTVVAITREATAKQQLEQRNASQRRADNALSLTQAPRGHAYLLDTARHANQHHTRATTCRPLPGAATANAAAAADCLFMNGDFQAAQSMRRTCLPPSTEAHMMHPPSCLHFPCDFHIELHAFLPGCNRSRGAETCQHGVEGFHLPLTRYSDEVL